MPWYWIVIIVSAVIGPFESYYVINKALRRRKEREQKQASAAKAETPDKHENKKG